MSHSYLAVSNKQADPRYPYAPLGWSEEQAQAFARQEGIEFGPDQKALIGSIQECVHRNDDKPLNTRRLSDALDEAFHLRAYPIIRIFRIFIALISINQIFHSAPATPISKSTTQPGGS